MNKLEFLAELRSQLSHLPQCEVDDIIRDQDEYIQNAVLAGRPETEVLDSLGSPKAFAQAMNAEGKLEKAQEPQTISNQIKNNFGAMLAVLALTPFNLIFVLGPYFGAVGLLIGGWAMAVGSIAFALSVLFAFLFKFIFYDVGFWTHVSTFFLAVGGIGLSILGVLFMYHVSKTFLHLTVKYLKWNLNFIRARA